MTLHIRDGAGQSAIAKVRVRDASGISLIGQIRVRDPSNTLVSIFGAFSATAAPSPVYGSTFSHAPVTVSTAETTVTVTPAGAATYSWSAADPGWVATAPTSATTAFRYAGLAPSDTQSTVWTCTVTRGSFTTTVAVNAQVDNYGYL